jgi:hypothetical protein
MTKDHLALTRALTEQREAREALPDLLQQAVLLVRKGLTLKAALDVSAPDTKTGMATWNMARGLLRTALSETRTQEENEASLSKALWTLGREGAER